MRNSNLLKLKAGGILLLLLYSTIINAQTAYNPPANAVSGNYTSGNTLYCAYNVHATNLQVSNTADYTIRAGSSIKLGNGCSFNSAGGSTFYAYIDPNYNLTGCNNVASPLVWDNYYTGDGSIVRYKRPLDYQLYPRKTNNKGDVILAATTTNGVYLITIRVTKTSFNNNSTTTEYGVSISNFHFSTTIQIDAELSEYKFEYQLNGGGAWTLIADKVVCGDAYFISGQSNAETGDLSQTEINNLNNAYGTTGNNVYAKYGRAYGGTWSYNGGWGVSHTNLGNTFHVGAWGLFIQENIMETYGIPVCIINNAVGGHSSIFYQHLPVQNSGEEFYNTVTQNYRDFPFANSRIYQAGLENDLKGIFWLHGDAIVGYAATESYISQFSPLYDLWNKYFPNYTKGYIVQIPSWVEGGNGNEDNLRVGSEEQRNFPLYFPKMKVMSGNGIGNHRNDQPEDLNGCGRHVDYPGTLGVDYCGRHGIPTNSPIQVGNEIHHTDQGYIELGTRLFRLLEVDFYGKTTNINDIYPPNIQSAYMSGNTIGLVFDQNLSTTNSDDLNHVLSVIKINGGSSPYTLSNPVISGHTFQFNVSPTTNITSVSYAGFLPGKECPFDGDYPCYLRNSKNVAALSFHNISIGLPKQTLLQNSVTKSENSSFNIYPNPNNGNFTIRFDGAGEKEIIVSDVLGRNVKTLETKSLNLEMNLSDLKQGVYFIKVKSGAEEITKKMIIE